LAPKAGRCPLEPDPLLLIVACWDTADGVGVAVEAAVEELGARGEMLRLTSEGVDELWPLATAMWRTAMTRAVVTGRVVARGVLERSMPE
jgi:hypothetical protein